MTRAVSPPRVPFSTLGRSPYAHRKSSSSYSFPQEPLKQRWDCEASALTHAPGVGSYDVSSASLHATLGAAGPRGAPLDSNTRWAADSASRTNLGMPTYPHTLPPGPGLYMRTHNSFQLTGSTHMLAGWRNTTSAGWQGYSRRECQTPMFVSRGHERERYGTQSPGPATAAPMDALGRQLVSQRRTQPRYTFSRAGRFTKVAPSAAMPGPGAYDY